MIRAKVYDAALLEGAPATFKAAAARWKDMKDRKYTLQVAPEDCTGCTLCVEVCPVKRQERGEARAPSTWCRSRRSAKPKRPTGTSS